MVVFGKKWLYSGKLTFGQIDFMVVIWQKWLYSGKVVVFGQSGCNWANVVVFGQSV